MIARQRGPDRKKRANIRLTINKKTAIIYT